LIPLGVAADLRPTALENIQLRVGSILQHYCWYWQSEIRVRGEAGSPEVAASIGFFAGYTPGWPGRRPDLRGASPLGGTPRYVRPASRGLAHTTAPAVRDRSMQAQAWPVGG